MWSPCPPLSLFNLPDLPQMRETTRLSWECDDFPTLACLLTYRQRGQDPLMTGKLLNLAVHRNILSDLRDLSLSLNTTNYQVGKTLIYTVERDGHTFSQGLSHFWWPFFIYTLCLLCWQACHSGGHIPSRWWVSNISSIYKTATTCLQRNRQWVIPRWIQQGCFWFLAEIKNGIFLEFSGMFFFYHRSCCCCNVI